ncbi:hypothetical protein H1R17_13420 [Flavobacterium sp. xlx-214]|uniref:hypothetical protein n=1 Tax=unclassified Flavobacterium TaxID=196869 RepID=UPI0013CFB8A8|nr:MULTISPECIES: hypothetical protein [unclassified Flavobacterium]MBA5791408.1 hypothetical protein [Flavobacterium sp. xlx-221]QMI83441.1 hypothetical protein H1R17_13420 [Flavobacterium sp. xlx-214]
MLKKLLLVFFTILLLSCKNENNKVIENLPVYGMIYFCYEDVSTIKSVNCDEFINNLKTAISYIKINDKQFIEQLKLNSNETDISYIPNYIDVRYRIEINSMIICLDYFGHYTINGVIKGKLKNFDYILNYIEQHKQNAIRLEELPILDEEDTLK